ncbi:MAG: hypothetical protein M5U13_04040 [Thermoanaerobaculia bacterium]|nr:hypothetical protein [Thermoanaerobaculia bacterium]
MAKKDRDDCCERYREGKKLCKGCPLRETLTKKERRKLREKHRG